MKKSLALLTLGSILEYYDFAIYLFFAKKIGESLIPINNPITNLIVIFAIYAAGALIRPLGGLVFSYFGDKYSRKKSLNTSILIMALSTLAIGLIPNYQNIGMLSVVLLILLRFTQSFAVGGEVPAAMVFAYEISTVEKKALYTNIAICGTNIGLLFASIVCGYLSNHATGELIWRSGFIIGGIAGIGFMLLRRQLSEPNEFTQALNSYNNVNPIKNLFKNNRANFINALMFNLFIAASVTVFIGFMPSYLLTFYNIPLNIVMKINSNSIFIFLICSLIAGKFYYLFNRRFFLISIIIFIGLINYLFNIYGNITYLKLEYFHYLMFIYLGIIAGRLPVILNNLFPISIRYTGVSLTYNLSFGIIGGLSQVILFGLIDVTNLKTLPAIYVSIFALVAWIFFYFTNDNQLNQAKEN